MARPSDSFFKDVVKGVGGKLAKNLPELERRLAAVKALGGSATLAELAVKMELISAEELEELEKLEAGEVDEETEEPARSKGTPSAGKIKSPSAGKIKTPSAGKVPAKEKHGEKHEPEKKPAKKRLRDRARGVSSAALRALASLKPGKRKQTTEEAPKDRTPLLMIGGASTFLVLMAGAIGLVVSGGPKNEEPAPPPPLPVAPPPAPPPPAPAPSLDPPVEPPPPALPQPPAAPDDAEGLRKGQLAIIAGAAIAFAKRGDFANAGERLAALKAAAHPEDQALVSRTELAVTYYKTRPPPGGSVPPPPAEPSRDAVRYAGLRASLDPLLAKLDARGARDVLASAPTLRGDEAAALDYDRKAPDAIEKLLAVLPKGLRPFVGKEKALNVNGSSVNATIESVSDTTFTITIRGGGRRVVSWGELARFDLQLLVDRATEYGNGPDAAPCHFALALVDYYAHDFERAKRSFAYRVDRETAQHYLARIERESAAPPGPAPPAPLPPAPPPPPVPFAPPPPPPSSGPDPDLGPVSKLVHVRPTAENGRVLLSYTMKDEAEPTDWEGAGVDRFAVCDTMRPGYFEKLRCAELVISAHQDSGLAHRVAAKGDFSYTVELFATSTDTANLVLVVGYDPAKKRWIGARWGQQLVSWDGKKQKVLAGKEPDLEPFQQARWRSIRLDRKGDRLAVSLDNEEKAACNVSGCDGRWGIVGHDLKIGIRRVDFEGTPDLSFGK